MKRLATKFAVILLAAGCVSVIAGDYTPSSLQGTTQSDQSITNGQIVTLSAGINYITSAGLANGYTNFVTLTVPPNGGIQAIVINSHSSSNVLTVSTSAYYRSAAFELTAGEAGILYSGDNDTVTNWYGLGN